MKVRLPVCQVNLSGAGHALRDDAFLEARNCLIMATFTAQVLIGHSHPNHDGIFPTHALMVSENSRAALVLVPFEGYDEDEPVPDGAAPRRIVWIPDPRHVVDDLMLQVCIHVLHQTAVTEQAEAIVAGLSTADYADLSDLSLERTYAHSW